MHCGDGGLSQAPCNSGGVTDRWRRQSPQTGRLRSFTRMIAKTHAQEAPGSMAIARRRGVVATCYSVGDGFSPASRRAVLVTLSRALGASSIAITARATTARMASGVTAPSGIGK